MPKKQKKHFFLFLMEVNLSITTYNVQYGHSFWDLLKIAFIIKLLVFLMILMTYNELYDCNGNQNVNK